MGEHVVRAPKGLPMHSPSTAVRAPWEAALSPAEHSLVFYALVVAGLAMFVMFVRTWTSRNEVSSRYRPALYASLGVVGAAFLSYVVLVLKFDLGYDPRGGSWHPNSDAFLSWAPRYMDWTVTVPLLVVELIAVSALVGAMARRVRAIGIAAAFLMIFTGYLGGVVIDNGESLAALWTWGIISSVFFVVLYAVVLFTVLRSLRSLPPAARPTYRNAMILLLVVWFVYPIVFGFQGYTSGGGWTTGLQLALCLADVAAKVGFGSLIHKIAKLRTAHDVSTGEDTHPESVWVSQVKGADAVTPAVQATDTVVVVDDLLPRPARGVDTVG